MSYFIFYVVIKLEQMKYRLTDNMENKVVNIFKMRKICFV